MLRQILVWTSFTSLMAGARPSPTYYISTQMGAGINLASNQVDLGIPTHFKITTQDAQFGVQTGFYINPVLSLGLQYTHSQSIQVKLQLEQTVIPDGSFTLKHQYLGPFLRWQPNKHDFYIDLGWDYHWLYTHPHDFIPYLDYQQSNPFAFQAQIGQNFMLAPHWGLGLSIDYLYSQAQQNIYTSFKYFQDHHLGFNLNFIYKSI